jgi:hypothetical protein
MSAQRLVMTMYRHFNHKAKNWETIQPNVHQQVDREVVLSYVSILSSSEEGGTVGLDDTID